MPSRSCPLEADRTNRTLRPATPRTHGGHSEPDTALRLNRQQQSPQPPRRRQDRSPTHPPRPQELGQALCDLALQPGMRRATSQGRSATATNNPSSTGPHTSPQRLSLPCICTQTMHGYAHCRQVSMLKKQSRLQAGFVCSSEDPRFSCSRSHSQSGQASRRRCRSTSS